MRKYHRRMRIEHMAHLSGYKQMYEEGRYINRRCFVKYGMTYMIDRWHNECFTFLFNS